MKYAGFEAAPNTTNGECEDKIAKAQLGDCQNETRTDTNVDDSTF